VFVFDAEDCGILTCGTLEPNCPGAVPKLMPVHLQLEERDNLAVSGVDSNTVSGERGIKTKHKTNVF